jgi:hypothetical protein|tara:strand:- start:961 stop:1254 length:294 start_codon:yes stop_codon:yes gene_type:complete
MTRQLNINPKSLQLSKTSPIYREMQKPQLMLVRHLGYSTFFKNKKLNEQIQDEWRRANPHKIRRPKRQENQGLSLEMTKDEYLRQEREKNQKNQKKK